MPTTAKYGATENATPSTARITLRANCPPCGPACPSTQAMGDGDFFFDASMCKPPIVS